MGKVLKCGELVPGCDFEARGSEEEVLQQAGRHATEAHGMQVDETLVETVRAHLRED